MDRSQSAFLESLKLIDPAAKARRKFSQINRKPTTKEEDDAKDDVRIVKTITSIMESKIIDEVSISSALYVVGLKA